MLMAKPTTTAIGRDKEQLAERFLRARGLRTLARNYRCRPGEIDLIMRDGQTLVFVEVRFRRSARYGTAAETVGRVKQHRLAQAAAHYLQRHPSVLPCRFDVVAITADTDIQWVKHAFLVES